MEQLQLKSSNSEPLAKAQVWEQGSGQRSSERHDFFKELADAAVQTRFQIRSVDLLFQRASEPEIDAAKWGSRTFNPAKPELFVDGWYITRGNSLTDDHGFFHDMYLFYLKTLKAMKSKCTQQYAPLAC